MALTINDIKTSEIIFLTPTFGTKWVFYQQFLLKKFFPKSKKILIDGNLRWDFNKGLDCVWYDFIKIALQYKSEYKYFVHIDEDCFLINSKGIIKCIEALENQEADLIGPAEVIYRIRAENPKALNSFLMIGKIASLEKVMKGYQVDLTFNELNIPLDPPIEEYKVEYEPYYDFFWNYYKEGLKILNFSTNFDEKFKCTGLLDSDNELFGYHMWFTRNWRDRKDTGWGVTMYQRYLNMGNYLKSTFGMTTINLLNSLSGEMKTKYLLITYSRVVSKNIFRIKRELKKVIKSK